MMNVVIRTAALVFVTGLWLTSATAAETDNTKFKEEISKQDNIYRSDGDKTIEGYTVDRSLSVYALGLPSDFDRALANLGAKDRWLDIGAGKGHAILDYYAPGYDERHAHGQARSGKKAQAVAMSIEDRRTPLWKQTASSLGENQIQYLSNRRLREYSSEELGKFQVITDVIGGFSYTDNLSLFMEKVLGILDVNGSFYTVLQDVQWEDGKNRPHYKGAPFLTELTNADGSELKVCAWLKRIACAEVTCESRASWTPPMEAFRVRKVCDAVTVPALAPVHYQAGTPPERRFQIKN